jgi:polar amino acid transport system substrate-binding protein
MKRLPMGAPGLGAALVLTLQLAAPLAHARCEGYVPQPKPQNADRDIVGKDLDEIQERGWIEFALYENFPPYSFDEGGEPAGIDVEIGRIVAAELGVEPRFRLVAVGENLDADLFNYVWKGAVVDGHVSNVMMHVPYDSDFACRVEQVVFTGQYATESLAIAYLRDAYPEDPPLPAYFRFDSVAVENDSISDFYLSGLAGGQILSNIHRYPSAEAAMAALAGGEVKAAMGPLGELQAGMTEAIGVHQPPLPGLAKEEWTLGVAVHMSYRALGYAVDDAISAALQDGRIAGIYEARGLTFRPPVGR